MEAIWKFLAAAQFEGTRNAGAARGEQARAITFYAKFRGLRSPPAAEESGAVCEVHHGVFGLSVDLLRKCR
jgi:hypothetical protein